MEDLNATYLNKNIKVTFYYTTELSNTIRYTHYGPLDKLTGIQLTNAFLHFMEHDSTLLCAQEPLMVPSMTKMNPVYPQLLRLISILSYHLQ